MTGPPAPAPVGAPSLARALGVGSVVAVCAHPDDESFGLGGVLGALSGAGASAAVLSFTHGEASTLHGAPGELGSVRAAELAAAARALGVRDVTLLDHPDGRLAGVDVGVLADEVVALAGRAGADGLLAFDTGGVTGHPDHRRATEAALVAGERLGLPVIGWAVPDRVAHALNRAFGTDFVGRAGHEVDVVVRVDRRVQLRAIACHTSQAADNPVLWQRLELQGEMELLRWLRPPPGRGSIGA